MEKKSLDQLREMARAAGLRGYSGLRKKQLIELLTKPKERLPAAPSSTPARAPKKSGKPASNDKAAPTASNRRSPEPNTPSGERFATAEQHIESAKFEMTLPGAPI